jgi:hypothetical protein
MRQLIFFVLLGLFMGFAGETNAQQINEAPLNGLYKNAGVINKKPIPYPSLRRADVMWQKRVWRVVVFL